MPLTARGVVLRRQPDEARQTALQNRRTRVRLQPVLRLVFLLLLAGCFPYRELYRPDVRGRVVDEGGAAVAGATVRSCSYTHWYRPKIECPRSVETRTDADGGFALPALHEWEWCCFGEAPLPITELYVCHVDGGAGYTGSSHGWPESEIVLRLGDGSPRCLEP